MHAARTMITRWLPEPVLDRYRLGLLILSYLFLLMTVPYIASSDAPASQRIVTLGLYSIIAFRWYQWHRGGRPAYLDHAVEFVTFWLTASMTGDAFLSATPLWAAACFVPVFVSRGRLAVVVTGYSIAYLSGLAVAASAGFLLEAQVMTQPPTIMFTAGMVYFFARLLARQQALIEENEQAARLATASGHRFRSLVEAIPGVILTSTPGGGIRYASPQLEPLFGFSLDDVNGDWATIVMRVIHPDDQEGLVAVMMAGVANGTPLSPECRAVTSAGETIWIQLHSVLVDDGSPDAPVWQSLIFDVTERHSLTEQLTHQAFHDALTGLPNRLLFDDRVNHALERSQRDLLLTAVCFIDLDNFKIVNDSLGHKYGDLLVVEVAQRLRSCLRQGDTVARLGGDEFALLLERQRDHDDTIVVAERILERLAKPYDIDGQPVFTSASIGIAFAGCDPIPGAELIRHADVAMYEAKRRGKGRYEIFEPYMETYARQRMDLEVELRDRLTSDADARDCDAAVALQKVQQTGCAGWFHGKAGIF
jgi:diguanylate cyclase (GGDEF)-like protein/PAS domain S-box-containing protein